MEKSHGMYFSFPRIWPKSANLGADQTESFLVLKEKLKVNWKFQFFISESYFWSESESVGIIKHKIS